MKTFTRAIICSALFATAACSTQPASAPEATADADAPERGLGKADGVFGSCFDEGKATCGGPAAEGNCWCDEACLDYGDCCSDKAEACGGDDPEPTPNLCLSDEACGDGQVCDHTECLSGCSGGGICPAVCFGECVDDTDPEPEPEGCGAPEDYVDVDGDDLFANPGDFVGKMIALTGSARLGFPICTQLACSPEAPCCNSCGAGIEMDTGAGTLEVSGLGCGGNNCDVMSNCDYDMGDEFVAWGRLENSFGFLHLDVDGHCAPEVEPEPEPGDECDCEEGELCIPLCPVCAAGTPPEQCQCTSSCIAGPDEPPCFLSCLATCTDSGDGTCEDICNEQCENPTPTFCGDDSDCGADEVCDPNLCIPSCPFCLDCNAACVPKL